MHDGIRKKFNLCGKTLFVGIFFNGNSILVLKRFNRKCYKTLIGFKVEFSGLLNMYECL